MSAENIFITKEEISPDSSGPLSGKSVAIKDNICTNGVRTTCASEMLSSFVPPYDATVVTRIKESGGQIVGKTNMDEFGMGGTTETSAFGPTKNPLDTTRVPGGSSGGSAAAVASGEADVALGSDTGGSIRNPAAFCGVVGIKPTYGLVSRYGLVAYANSLEQIGPIASSVQDAAQLLDVIAGPDERDATTRDDVGSGGYESAATSPSVSGTTIGIIEELDDGDSEVLEVFHDGVEALADAGATVKRVSLESISRALAAYYIIAMAEASSNLARFDGVRYGLSGGYDGDWNEVYSRSRNAGFGEEVKRRIILGTFALSEGYQDKYYGQAQDARRWIKQDFERVFSEVDVLATPTMPIIAPELGERIDDPMELYLMDANTVPVNLANLPAISVPAGCVDGLPVGCQFIGKAFDEATLVQVGSAFEDR